MARLRARGLTFTEIGRQLGVTRQCVTVTLAKAGVPPLPINCRECEGVIVAHRPGNRPSLPALCLGCLARHPDASFADRLRAFRLAAGLTQGELADQAGLPKGTVNGYEQGRGLTNWLVVVALARVLGVGLLTLGLGLPEGPGHESSG
jgi:DNA-binding XRE family transcriptional regulator